MPALGRPTRPTSASNLSRSQTHSSSPGLAGLVLARGAVGRGLVAGVAAAAHAALEQGDALALIGEVGEQAAFLVVGEDLGADRNLDDQILAAGAGAVGARAALAARRAEMLGVAEIDQRIEARHGFEDDVAALAAVAAVGAAEFDELFAPEADRARGRPRPTARRSWPGRENASLHRLGQGGPSGEARGRSPSFSGSPTGYDVKH